MQEIESAIVEAEGVRARHDGVHVIHSYVTALRCYQLFAENGDWSEGAERGFREITNRVRCINRTGFPPKAMA